MPTVLMICLDDSTPFMQVGGIRIVQVVLSWSPCDAKPPEQIAANLCQCSSLDRYHHHLCYHLLSV